MADIYDTPFVIGISGASGSGKTWFANQLKNELYDSSCIFTLDSYYKNVDYVNCLEYRHDNPSAIDYDKAFKDLSILLRGKILKLPKYDYDTHEVISETIIKPTPVIIIEGLFAFSNKRFFDVMDLKVWIEAHEDIRFNRRISRDIDERGDNYEDVISRYKNDVEPAYYKYTKKGIEFADCIFLNSTNNNKKPLLIDIIVKYARK